MAHCASKLIFKVLYFATIWGRKNNSCRIPNYPIGVNGGSWGKLRTGPELPQLWSPFDPLGSLFTPHSPHLPHSYLHFFKRYIDDKYGNTGYIIMLLIYTYIYLNEKSIIEELIRTDPELPQLWSPFDPLGSLFTPWLFKNFLNTILMINMGTQET